MFYLSHSWPVTVFSDIWGHLEKRVEFQSPTRLLLLTWVVNDDLGRYLYRWVHTNLNFPCYAPSCLSGGHLQAGSNVALPYPVFDITCPIFQHMGVALISPQQGMLPYAQCLADSDTDSRLEWFCLWGFSLSTNWKLSVKYLERLAFCISLLILILENLSRCCDSVTQEQ